MPKKKEIKRILVSQPKPAHSKSPYFQLESEYGVELFFKPLFTIEPLTSRQFREQKISILEHTAVVLTSRTMMANFFNLVKGLRLELPDDMKYFCPSEVLSAHLHNFITVRKRKVYYPEKMVNETKGLQELITKYPKEKFFIPIIEGTLHEETFSDLEEQAINFTPAILGRVVYTPLTEDEIEGYDLLVFFSPNGVDSLYHSLPSYKQGGQMIACMGEKTKHALDLRGLRVDASAPSEQYPSITAAIESLLKK